MNITTDKWIIDRDMPNHANIVSVYDEKICSVYIGEKSHNAEAEANVKFITDAGNVAIETGFTPRQLADQNKELREALKQFLNYYESDFIQVSANDGRTLASMISKMDAALKTPKQ